MTNLSSRIADAYTAYYGSQSLGADEATRAKLLSDLIALTDEAADVELAQQPDRKAEKKYWRLATEFATANGIEDDCTWQEWVSQYFDATRTADYTVESFEDFLAGYEAVVS